jgi:hypothetical protein
VGVFVAQIKVPRVGIICATKKNLQIHKLKKWSFCNVYLSMSQQKQCSPMQIHKRTAMNKLKLRTRILHSCVFVYELKKSQPK